MVYFVINITANAVKRRVIGECGRQRTPAAEKGGLTETDEDGLGAAHRGSNS